MKRILSFVALVATLMLVAASATAITLHVPADQPTVAAALAVAAPNDVILVAPGTYVLGATLHITVANLTLQGSGIGSTVLQTQSSVGDAIAVNAPGFTLRDLSLQKTDLPNQHLIAIQASGCTIRDNELYGPDPGTPWSANGIVSRAIVGSGGITGMLIQDNHIHHLRQPGYFSAPNDGVISGNAVGGTRGWVVEGAALTFTGNSFGAPEDQGADIALLSMCDPADYPDLLALSAANGNAYVSAQWGGAASGRAHAYVDAAFVGGWGSAAAPLATVQAGVNGTLPGGTVSVAAGTYTEQVVVAGKNLTLQGAGRALTTIQSPVSLATSFATPGNNNFAVLLARDAADVRVSDLTVDGAGRGNGNYRFVGVAFFNAGGRLLHADVKGVRETPFNGDQHGVALHAYTTTGGPYALEVGDVALTDFQKNATVFAGTGLTVNAHDLTVTGAGPTGVTAQNGVQVSDGALATLTNLSVSGIFYAPADWLSCGLLAYDAAGLTVSGTNSFAGCQAGFYVDGGDAAISGTSVSGAYWAALVYNLSSTIANRARPARAEGRATPPPADVFDGGGMGGAGASARGAASLVTVSIADGCLLGADLTNTAGVYAWSNGGGLSLSLTGMEVKDWDAGVVCDGPVSLTAHHDAFTSNLSAGLDNTLSGVAQDATLDWWGDASGPGGVGGGSGDAVLGANVAFGSWLVSGADANAGCGFAPGPDNVIAAGPAPSCLSAAHTCITVPVTIARTTGDGMRGFSVRVQLSSNLVLCGAGIAEGTYLSGVSGTAFQVVDEGGGAYTVDGAILGLPCGATAPTGTLFTLEVAKAPLAPNGTGTITVGTVVARDCANAPIAVTAGAPLAITIDGTAPVAIADLAAAKKPTGNDADGTTKILLTFTAPGDADVVEVYRAPFGSYPEYDDGGGSAAATPTYPPAAPWTLTAVTATGQYDEPVTRGFWSYVAFTRDACGNVSAVSNRTSGTLDYHLGDVVDPAHPLAVGDNLVGSSDMSRLGAHYGISLAFEDPFNYLDVGPTTDYSVNARPTTDNRVNFEDLMMFAIDYGQVSIPRDALAALPAASDALGLSVPALPAVGQTFAVSMRASGAGDVQGASVRLAYDAAVVEPAGVEAGELLLRQSHPTVVLSPSPGVVDFALLGEGAGLAGEGEAVRVLFRVKAAGEAGIAIADVVARDVANHPVVMGGTPVTGPVVPARTELGLAAPNPFGSLTTLALSLARESRVRVSVYDLSGRRVRTLLDGVQPAGARRITWDGRDGSGTRLAAGIYLVRLETDGIDRTRRVQLVP